MTLEIPSRRINKLTSSDGTKTQPLSNFTLFKGRTQREVPFPFKVRHLLVIVAPIFVAPYLSIINYENILRPKSLEPEMKYRHR